MSFSPASCVNTGAMSSLAWRLFQAHIFINPRTAKRWSNPEADDLARTTRLYEEWATGKGPDPTTVGLSREEREQVPGAFATAKGDVPALPHGLPRQALLLPQHARPQHHRLHVDEAIYAPLYYGYGGPGQYSDRVRNVGHIEEAILKTAPHTVSVLVKAEPDVIRRRMKESPHEDALVQDKDLEYVLQALKRSTSGRRSRTSSPSTRA